MNRSIEDLFSMKQRNNNSAKKNSSTTLYRTAQTDRTFTNSKRQPVMVSTMNDYFKKQSINKSQNDLKKAIAARHIFDTLAHKQKLLKNVGVTKIKEFGLWKKKSTENFNKILSNLEKNKGYKWRTQFFTKIKEPFIHHQGIDNNMNKLNDLLTPRLNNNKLYNKSQRLNKSNTRLDIEKPAISKSISTANLKKKQERHAATLQQFEKIWKQNSNYRNQQITKEAKDALIKIKRLQPRISSITQIQGLTGILNTQVKRLESIKLADKQKKVDYFDNQLAISVINNLNHLISTMNKEIKEFQKLKLQVEKEEAKRKEQQIKKQMEVKSNKDFHAKNVQRQMRVLMDDIYSDLSERQFHKSKIKIRKFLDKYEKEQFAADRVHFYHAIDESLENYSQIDKCLDETCNILQVLSIADLEQVDECIRSLKANHKDFNYLRGKYKHSNKFHGKKMNNILHNLLKFNDDIIKYLETKKERNKKVEKDRVQMEKLKNKYQAEIKGFGPILDKEKKRSTLAEVQLERAKHINSNITEQNKAYKAHEDLQKLFEKKLGLIIDKMRKKRPQWQNDFELLKKDEQFSGQKPFTFFFQFIEQNQSKSDQKVKKELQQIGDLFDKIRKIFQKPKLKNQEKFTEIVQILGGSGKKNPNLIDFYKSIEVLMITITGKTRQESEIKKLKDLESNLQEEKIRVVNLRKQVKNWEEQSEKNSSRGSTPPQTQSRQRRKSITIGNELQTIEELIPKINNTFLKHSLTNDKKLQEATKLLDNTAKKKTSTKKVNDLLINLLRNVIYQEDDSPTAKIDRRRSRGSVRDFSLSNTFIKGFQNE